MSTWNTLPERHILDSMREAAGISVEVNGQWFVVMQDQRDVIWFLASEPAEACADELAADAVESGMVEEADVQHLAADLIASGLARGVVL